MPCTLMVKIMDFYPAGGFLFLEFLKLPVNTAKEFFTIWVGFLILSFRVSIVTFHTIWRKSQVAVSPLLRTRS